MTKPNRETMTRISVGITGNSGFIGYHLANHLNLTRELYEVIPFSRESFREPAKLDQFVVQCEVIVHLAAMNRGDPTTLYECNISLVSQLIESMERTGRIPHVIFSSSTQESLDNPYGRSKAEGRRLFETWARRTGGRFTCLIIPNVFGPFGRPFHNSVVSTFCFQLTHNQKPKIEIDAELNLIYVGSVVETICSVIQKKSEERVVQLWPDTTISVSGILSKLEKYAATYLDEGIIPELSNRFELNLFNTFRLYIEPSHFPVTPECKSDHRGYLVELVKEKTGGQTFVSLTNPGVTRGNHFHTSKIERFCVISGDAVIMMRRIGTSEVLEFHLNGNHPGYVDIPVWYTHSITNTGSADLTTLFWTNELFDPANPDTYHENV
jgi:UDP-2-acetamido-2,6-beta-L-arabino-hexul-4-ose reductase